MSYSIIPPPRYEYVTRSDRAKQILSELVSKPVISVDTETTSLDVFVAKLCLIQIATGDINYVFDVRYDTQFSDIHPNLFVPLFTNPNILKIFQNGLYDVKIFKLATGADINNIYDTMLSEQLLHLGLNVRAGLAALVQKYLFLDMPKEPAKTFADYYQEYRPFQLEYAANDVVVLDLIRQLQSRDLVHEGLMGVAKLEFDFIKPLSCMELQGVEIDVDKWRIIMEDLKPERTALFNEVNAILSDVEDQTTLFGAPVINIDSQKQLLKALKKYGLEDIESTDVGVLSNLQDIPVVEKILEYRAITKIIGTYGENLLGKIHPVTGRLHTSFKQLISTGRLSSQNPNLQNIPGKQKYRTGFVAKRGYSLITADMSGAELRIMGNLSKDPIFVNSYAKGLDLHTVAASMVYNIPYDKVEPNQRKAVKAIQFGLCTIEDTQVLSNSGIKKINEVSIGEEVAHDVGKDIVIDKAYMGEKEVFELKTKYGYSIELTKDHLIKVITKEGKYADVKLSNLDINNDLICLKKNAQIFSSEDFLFPTVPIKQVTNFKDFIIPDKLDYKWSAFLGLFVAEGSLIKAKKHRANYGAVSFHFSNKEKDFIKEVDLLFNELFGDRLQRVESETSILYSVCSVKLCSWLKSLFDIDFCNKTDSINIPVCIKKASKEYQCTFLKFLFEGDGTVKLNEKGFKISYSSNSIKLIRDIQLLLLNMGIVTSITEETRAKYDKIYYVLSIISEGCSYAFLDQVGFISWSKRRRNKTTVSYNTSYFFVGRHKERIEKIIRNNKVSKQLKDRFYKKRFGDSVGNIYLKELSQYDPFFKFIYDNDIVSLPIESITSRGIKKVYDLSVANHQYFLANGFVIHNCYGLSKFGLSRRLKITENEAQQLIDSYFANYKGIKNFLDNNASFGLDNLYSRSISGRKRYYYLPPHYDDDFSKIARSIRRKAMNHPVQGCLVGETYIEGIGRIDSLVGKKVTVETGFGKDTATGVFSGVNDVFNLKLSNGISLGITMDHLIPVLRKKEDGRFTILDVEALNLKKEDLLLSYTKDGLITCTMESIDYLGKRPTYDLMCDTIHYFVADGIVVHNSNADTIKKAMILLCERLEEGGYDAKLILTVHDEIVVESKNEQVKEVKELVTSSIVDGFGHYFKEIPMETDAVVGPCWVKGVCENKNEDGKKCGHTESEFIKDEHYGTKLICKKCGNGL